MLDLTARDRRAVKVGLLALIPAMAYIGVFQPYVRTLGELHSRVRIERERLARELALVSVADELRDQVRRAGVESSAEQQRLFGIVDDITPLELEKYVVRQAERSRVYVEQAETHVQDATASGIVPLTADIRAVSDFRGAMAFLYALETGPKLMHLDRVALQSTGLPDPSGSERLSIMLRVVAFALPDSVASRPNPGKASR